jgi:hypothetical protein
MADNDFWQNNNSGEEKVTSEPENKGNDSIYIPTKTLTPVNIWERFSLSRGLVITGMVTLGVGTLGFGVALFNTAIGNKELATQEQSKPEEKSQEELIAELKTKTALATQQAQLEKQLEAPEVVAKTEIKSTPTKSTPQPKIELKPAPIAKPAPIPEPIEVSPPPPVVTEPKPVPVVTAPPPERVTELNPPPQVIAQAPAPQIQQPTPQTPVETDPYEEWRQAADTGVYTANEVDPTTQQASQEINPNQEQPKVVAVSYPAPGSQPYEPTTPEEVNFEPEPQLQTTKPIQSPPRQYDVGEGTSIKAKLQNPVVLRGKVNRVQKYPIKITKAVKSADGTELIPDNSKAIAKVVSATTSGNIWMNVESVVIPAGNGVMQRQLPYGSMLVLARDGNPLKAKIRYPRIAVPRQTAIARASFKTQKAGNKSLKSPSRQTRLVALRRRLSTNSRPLRQQVKRYPTLSLKKGTKLQLYVNRSFNL